MADSTADPAEGLDPEMAAAMAQADAMNRAAGFDPAAPYDLAADRARTLQAAPFWAEGAPEVEDRQTLMLPGPGGLIRAVLHKPDVPGPAPIVVFLHGGGWVKGAPETYEWACRAIASASGLNVLAPAYRLAPEHPFPAALDDVSAVLDWCMGDAARAGLDHRRVLVAGASAGAALALAACLRRRDAGLDLPLSMALFYGVFGANLETQSYRAFADGRFDLGRETMRTFFDLYAPGRTAHPSIDLVNAPLHGLPPAWLSAAGKDVLRDDATGLAEALRAAGVETHLRVDDGLAHGYTARARMVPLARAAIDEAAGFLRAQSRRASRLAAYALS